MDFDYPPEAEAFRAEFRTWLDAHVTDTVRGLRGSLAFDDPQQLADHKEWNARLADAGYAAIAWPVGYGGRGAGVMEQVVWAEELHRAGAPGPLNVLGIPNVAPAIMTYGTEEQKTGLLPRMLRGDDIWCQGFSEPDAGSDLAGLKTTAVQDGDDWVINGQKVWTSLGQHAQWCELLVRTDPDVPKHRGITCLLVDMSTPGITVRPLTTITGSHDFNEVFLDDVRVPASSTLGPVHEGWRVAMTTLTHERGGVAKLHLGLRASAAQLLDAAKTAPGHNGTTAAQDPVLRQQLARVYLEAELLKLIADRAISGELHGRALGPESSIAKLQWSETDQHISEVAAAVLGADATQGAWGLDRLSCRQATIAGGTTQINKNIIAQRILGLPPRLTVSVAQYLFGVVLLAAIVGALGFGAYEARARWLPSWRGAPARLAEITGALAVFITVPQLLGTVGWFRRWPVEFALVTIGIGVGLLARRASPRADDGGPITEDSSAAAAGTIGTSRRTRTSTTARVATIGAAVLVGIVTAQWLGHVFSAYRDGIHDGDSLWYHLPFATSWFQSGFTTRPLLVGPNSLIAFFPGNGETVSGVTMLLFRHDIAVPVLSLGWLALALLAGWCLGTRYRAGAVGLAAVALLMDVPLMAATQAGTARNDAMSVALVLTAAALLAHADWDPVAIALAGAANGIAFGVKLSSIPVCALLVVAVVVIAPRGRRLVISLTWLGAFVAFGAFWYVRNIARVGNPFPWVELHLGPLTLSKVTSEDTANTAVIDQLRDSDGISRVLKDGTDWVLGPAWWLFLVVIVGVALAVAIVGRGRLARTLGVVALLGIVGYLVLPNGAPSPESPFAHLIFGLNIRYAFPAAVLAVAVTAVLPRMERALVAAGAVLTAVALDVTLWYRRGEFERGGEWRVTGGQRALAIGVAVLVVLIVVSRLLARWTAPRQTVAWIAGAVALVLLVGSYVGGHMSQDGRYDDTTRSDSAEAWKWAQDLPPTRVGIIGNLFQYPYVGPDLANHVRYVGVTRDDGGLRDVHTCRELRRALAEGDYEYLVTAPNFNHSNAEQIARVGEWVTTVPGTEVALHTDIATAYRLGRPMDPDACP